MCLKDYERGLRGNGLGKVLGVFLIRFQGPHDPFKRPFKGFPRVLSMTFKRSFERPSKGL